MIETLLGGCAGECGGCCFGLALILIVCCVLVGGVVLYINSEGPEPPLSDKFKPSASEAQVFKTAVDSATNEASTQGWFALVFQENEIASWMALEGEEFASANGHTFPFENVQVALDDGAMTFYGEIERMGLTLPIETTVEPQINTSGEMEFEITSVDVGGVALPDAALRTIQRQFEDVLLQPLDNLPGTPFFYEQTLLIDNGGFQVQGRIQP